MKREILKKYIDAWDSIESYKKSNFYYFEEKEYVSGSIANLDLKWKTVVKLPDIEVIKDELEILKKEIGDALSKKEEAESFLKAGCNCNHEVLVSNVDRGTCHYCDTCVLCGQKFYDSIIRDSGYNIGTIARKNKNHVVFEGKTITNDDGWCEYEEYTTYYTTKEIKDIIRDILKNNTNEDIDLVEEIKKLNLEHCIINNPKNITLILMIIGSNKFYLGDYSYVSQKYYDDYEKIIRYFQGMYNTVVSVLGSKEALRGLKEEPNSLFLHPYENLSDLDSYLNWYNNIPYNLIINMSNLFKYEIRDNKIVSNSYKLNLDEIFKDTPILDIHDSDILLPDVICKKGKSLIKVRGLNG